METVDIKNISFNEKGLVPAIVQDARSGEILMMAYMNQESLQKTIETGETWFFSRSRQKLWHKGRISPLPACKEDLRGLRCGHTRRAGHSQWPCLPYKQPHLLLQKPYRVGK